MAMKVTIWCDLCPTLLEMEGFEMEIKSRQILPRQDRNYNDQRLHVCGDCFDKMQVYFKPLKQRVNVKAEIEKPEGKS